MNILKHSIRIMCAFSMVWGLQVVSTGAETKPVYDQVLEALETMPRENGITVDFGVEESLYQETFQLTMEKLSGLSEDQVPQALIDKLAVTTNEIFASKDEFMQAVQEAIGAEQATLYENVLVKRAYDGRVRLEIGKTFEARFRADMDCYVALIHISIGTQDVATGKMMGGNITVFLPNLSMPEVRLKAGEIYSTSHDFSLPLAAAEPAGEEVINIMCSTKPFDLFAKTGTFVQDYAVIRPTDEPALQYLLKGLQQAAAEKFGGTGMLLDIVDPNAEAPVAQIPGTVRGGIPKKFGQVKPMGGTGTTGKFFPPLGKP